MILVQSALRNVSIHARFISRAIHIAVKVVDDDEWVSIHARFISRAIHTCVLMGA